MTAILQELMFSFKLAFWQLVPPREQRIPITWETGVYPILCYAPFIFLAYLARREGTYLIRLLMLPTAITGIIVSAYRFTWSVPQMNVYNWGQCLLAAVMIAKALEFAMTKEGMLKINEIHPGVLKGKEKRDGLTNGGAHDTPVHIQRNPYIATWFYDSMELILTLRGLKWKFGRGIVIPPETRSLERSAFLSATLISFTNYFLLLDVFESLLKLFPGVGDPSGGPMFYPTLSLPARYTVSTLIHLITGSSLLFGFSMVYNLITLVAVFVFDSDTTSWPPVMDDPWHADSMHRFWARDWHQLLRQTFLVYGGYPGKRIAGDMGMLFGTFLASGLFHECSIYSMGRGFDYHALLYFGAQGFVLLGERIWRKVTGRRVGGIYGRMLVYFNLFVGAQPMVNAWHRRGLGGGMVIPPMISPTRWILLPLATKFFLTIRQSQS